MRGHYLLSGNPEEDDIPYFISENPNPDEIAKFIDSYVETVVTHNKEHDGSVYAWDVVDEAVTEWNPYTVVPDWICKAFTIARNADPDPLLFYSDTGFAAETPEK